MRPGPATRSSVSREITSEHRKAADDNGTTLRDVIRSLPLSAAQREARRIQAWSLSAAVVLHSVAALSIASSPYTPPAPRGQFTGKPLATVRVVVVEKKDEKLDTPTVAPEPVLDMLAELEPPPLAEDLPELTQIKAVKIPPKRKQPVPKVRKEMVAQKTATAVKPEEKKDAPAPTTKAITSAAAGGSADPQKLVATSDTNGEPGGGSATSGSPEGTDSRNQSGSEVGADKGTDIDLAGLQRAYMRRVSKRVHRKYRYPRSAERARLTGRVLVEITIDADGNIVSSRVKRSSGHPRLDKAALRSIASLGKLPAPPRELRWKSKRVTIPFDYKLKG